MSKILIVIPARYDSTRLPGKPLLKIGGIEMIKRVAEIAETVCLTFKMCSYVVATDDSRISAFCQSHQIPSVMTPRACQSGSDRVWEAIQGTKIKPSLVINLQGDNPLCPPWFISSLIKCWLSNRDEYVVYSAYTSLGWNELDTLRELKKTTPSSGTTVQINRLGYALTFSKSILPLIREEEAYRVTPISPVKRHIGLYAYTYDALKNFTGWEVGFYERLERLEQMRFLENGVPIKMVEVSYRGRSKGIGGVDNPEDIARVEAIINSPSRYDFGC